MMKTVTVSMCLNEFDQTTPNYRENCMKGAHSCFCDTQLEGEGVKGSVVDGAVVLLYLCVYGGGGGVEGRKITAPPVTLGVG